MRKIALIGGDSRQISAAFTLKTAGFTPFVYGNDTAAALGFTAPYTLSETLSGAEAVLLAVPSVKNKGFLYTPLWEKNLPIADFLQSLNKNTVVFLWGNHQRDMQIESPIVNLATDEYCLRENARLTADIAIFLAMKETKLALCDMQTSVLGYGRIGKYLTKHLGMLGAKVKVGARRKESQEQAKEHVSEVYLPTDPKLLSSTDVIFNTIPHPILNRELLESAEIGTLYMELASAPGGLTDDAKTCPLCIVDASGLPGKYCARSAGKIIGESVLRHLEKRRCAP